MNIQSTQQGFVLVIGLLMLVVITIVGVTAMSSTTSNERMTANTQFQTISFQAAESAINDVFDIPSMENAVPVYPNTLAPGANNYDVDVGGGMIAVQAVSNIQFCGEDLSVGSEIPSGTEAALLDRVYDVRGTGSVASLNTQDQHMQRGSYPFASYDMPFDPVVCNLVQ